MIGCFIPQMMGVGNYQFKEDLRNLSELTYTFLLLKKYEKTMTW